MSVSPGHNVDLLYDRPAALGADLIFGADYVPPHNDVVVRATLPLPVASFLFIPPARLELLAELPGLTVSTLILRPSVPLNVGVASLPGVAFTGEVRYASRTQRPTVGQTAHEWQQAVQREDGAAQGQQDATATPAGWDAVWQRASELTHGIAHRLPPVLVAALLQRSTGQQQAMPLHAATWFRHEDATPIAPMRVAVFQSATLLRDTTRFAHQDGDRSKRAGRLALWQSARPLRQRQGTDFQSASRRPVGWRGLYQEALVAIVSAAGGYLIPHPSDQSIRVCHRYPVAPWEWNAVTPDFVLPVDAVARESLRWVEKPGYNRVFVSGQDVGVLGQVSRAGTAGDVLAPMVVDALITEAAAARQRGISVLADTGQQIEVTLRLPVLAETGIIEPGAFVEFQDGSVTRLGIVRSTQVEAGMPEVWQTLGVQSHA